MSVVKKNLDFILLAIIVAMFFALAAQRLGTNPVPHTDESYMLQVSYELIHWGKLAQPFNRYLGGNIENTLHSFTPAHMLIQTAFLKLFGWGILQGRVFNLIAAGFVLVLTYLIGRRLFGWKAGLFAIILLLADVSFLYRSRFLRNDFSAAAFALLAYLLYEEAERRKDRRWFAGSGLAAGLALMSHTVALYILVAIILLMLFRRGWRIIKDKNFYLFAAGAFIVSAYEIIYDIIDYKNVILQNRGDNLHFKVLTGMGWLKNLRREARRYSAWSQGSLMPQGVSRRLLHLFQFLAIIGLVYLLTRAVFHLKRRNAMSEPRVRILIVTATAIMFFAIVTSQKAIYYMAHLAPLFALTAGILVADSFDWLKKLASNEQSRWRIPSIATRAPLAVSLVLMFGYGYLFLRQSKQYLREVRNPDVASFEEFKTAIRSIVPEGVCPVVVREPVIWLAFTDHDDCFSNLQNRMRSSIDLDGKEYALIVAPKLSRGWLSRVARNNHHLLGEMANTIYGNYHVYYTGVDPRWLELKPAGYHFFGERGGYASEAQIAEAKEVWSATAQELNADQSPRGLTLTPEGLQVGAEQSLARSDKLVQLHSIQLKPETIYQLDSDSTGVSGQWALAVVDEDAKTLLLNQRIGVQEDQSSEIRLFKTGKTARLTIGAHPVGSAPAAPLFISRLGLREVASSNAH